MGLHQTEIFLQSEGNYQQRKRPPTQWDNIFAHDTANTGLKSNLYKGFNLQIIQLKM